MYSGSRYVRGYLVAGSSAGYPFSLVTNETMCHSGHSFMSGDLPGKLKMSPISSFLVPISRPSSSDSFLEDASEPSPLMIDSLSR